MNPLSGVGGQEYACATMSNRVVKGPRRFRVARKWTIRELAARADVTERTVWALEAGRPVSLETIRKVAVALGVPEDEVEESWKSVAARSPAAK